MLGLMKSSKIRSDDWTEFRREHQALYDFYYGLDYNQRFNNDDETEQKVHQYSQSRKEEANQDEASGSSRRDCDNSDTQAKD